MFNRVSVILLAGSVSVAAVITAVVFFVLPDSAGMTYSDRTRVKEAVGEGLRDPDSAQYKFSGHGGQLYCGEVNAKNGMGAYAGFTHFIADFRRAPPVVYTMTGYPETMYLLEKQIEEGRNHQDKVDLARCEGLLSYTDEKGRNHFIGRDGGEWCPTEQDSLHPC